MGIPRSAAEGGSMLMGILRSAAFTSFMQVDIPKSAAEGGRMPMRWGGAKREQGKESVVTLPPAESRWLPSASGCTPDRLTSVIVTLARGLLLQALSTSFQFGNREVDLETYVERKAVYGALAELAVVESQCFKRYVLVEEVSVAGTKVDVESNWCTLDTTQTDADFTKEVAFFRADLYLFIAEIVTTEGVDAIAERGVATALTGETGIYFGTKGQVVLHEVAYTRGEVEREVAAATQTEPDVADASTNQYATFLELCVCCSNGAQCEYNRTHQKFLHTVLFSLFGSFYSYSIHMAFSDTAAAKVCGFL